MPNSCSPRSPGILASSRKQKTFGLRAQVGEKLNLTGPQEYLLQAISQAAAGAHCALLSFAEDVSSALDRTYASCTLIGKYLDELVDSLNADSDAHQSGRLAEAQSQPPRAPSASRGTGKVEVRTPQVVDTTGLERDEWPDRSRQIERSPQVQVVQPRAPPNAGGTGAIESKTARVMIKTSGVEISIVVLGDAPREERKKHPV